MQRVKAVLVAYLFLLLLGTKGVEGVFAGEMGS